MEQIKDQTQPTNGAKPTDDIMAQIAALLQGAGYEGLGVIAIGPRTGQPHNPMDFLPTGDWQLQVVPIKARDD